MRQRRIYVVTLMFFIYALLKPKPTSAVIPPDFIFNIGAQIVQFLSFAVALIATIFASFFHFFKTKYLLLRRKKIVLVSTIGIVILLLGLSTYGYATHQQKVEYSKWLTESTLFSDMSSDNTNVTSSTTVQSTVEQENNTGPSEFFTQHTTQNISITNQEFSTMVSNGDTNFVVLDAREDVEYEYGHYPGSVHIRFADLTDGQWESLPKDKVIYVFCWSGMRGKEVTEFLRNHYITAFYVEEGAHGWVDYGGKWQGKITFTETYKDARYNQVLSTSDVKKHVSNGAVLIDAREPERYAKSHITGSISFPIMQISSRDIESRANKISKNSSIIIICDQYINCFSAKVAGVELEKRGYTLIGRYNKPWEYGS